MADPLYHVGAMGRCPHPAGLIQVTATSQRVKVSGQAVATTGDRFDIAGCLFNVSGSPSPCTKVQFIQPALRVKVGGKAVILKTSTGLCQSGAQAPQGPPSISVTQTRVKGT